MRQEVAMAPERNAIKAFCTMILDYYHYPETYIQGRDYHLTRLINQNSDLEEVPVFWTGSRSSASKFNNRYFTHDSDYDVTLLLAYQPRWRQMFTRALYAYVDDRNKIAYQNPNKPWESTSVRMRPMHFLSKDHELLGTFDHSHSYTPWREVIIERDGFLQIKFGNNNEICQAKFDLTICGHHETWVYRMTNYTILEDSLSNFASNISRVNNTFFLPRRLFDLYIRILKAVRPVLLNSHKVITLGVIAMQNFANDCNNSQELTTHFRKLYPVQKLDMLMNNFFGFCNNYLNEYGDWRAWRFWIQLDGKVKFERINPPKTNFEDVPEAYYVGQEGHASSNSLDSMTFSIRSHYQTDLRWRKEI